MFGNRVSVTDNGTTTERLFVQSALPSVAAEYQGNSLTKSHTLIGCVRLLTTDHSALTTTYYHADMLGSARLLTDGSGETKGTRSFKAFGETRTSTGETTDVGYVGTLGVETDPNGLLFMRNRYYDASMGRFMQMDPIGLNGGDVNFLSYCMNDPINFLDLDGKAYLINNSTAHGAKFIAGQLSQFASWLQKYKGGWIGAMIVSVGKNVVNYGADLQLGNDTHFWRDTLIDLGLQGIGTLIDLQVKDSLFSWQTNDSLINVLIDAIENTRYIWDTLSEGYQLYKSYVTHSLDPNEIVGPLGEGENRCVQKGEWMDYTIYFENMTNATAAAQEIFIDLPMDENLDWSTLELGEIAFGEHIDTSLIGKSLEKKASLKASYPIPGTNTFVKTEVTMKDGVLSWYLRDWDPTTVDNFPASATGGFLPPNDPETHCGEGHISYRVKVKADAPKGAVINAAAQIVFDSNPMIETDPSWWNTVGNGLEGGFAFTTNAVTVAEGGKVLVKVLGGSTNMATCVKVYLTYGTAAAADLNLGKTKYPITLKWAKGEVGEKSFTIPTKNDTAYEDQETFALQLAAPSGIGLGDVRTCIVTITDNDAGVSLKEGIMNSSIKVKTSGAGKWTVKRGLPRWEADGYSGPYHLESPTLKKGKSSTLQLSGMSGSGAFSIIFRFTGDTNETVSSTLKIYAGSKLMHTYRHTALGNDWMRHTLNDYRYGTHTYKYVFTQGSDPNCHVELSEAFWNPYWLYEHCIVSAYGFNPDAGKVTGSGWYKKGSKAKLVAKANPGWTFAGWYKYVEGDNGEEYVLWNKNATVTYTANSNLDVWAEFVRKPYVRGLADTVAGGKVTGSAYLASGGRVTLKAVPATNYHFDGWYASDESGERAPDALVGENLSLVVTNALSDVVFWAKFVLNAKVTVAFNAKRGNVTGTGRYAPGKTVTLKAAPKKGYAFTGWYDADGNLISLSATYKYKMTADGASLTASFKKESELAKPVLSWGDYVVGLAASDYETQPTATNLSVGVSYVAKIAVAAESTVSIIKVAGIPKGLSYKSGKVSGVPTKAGKYTASVTVALATNKKKTWVYKVPLTVAALPAWAKGTYNGMVGSTGGSPVPEENAQAARSTNGLATVTVSSAGKISGKFQEYGTNWTLTAASYTVRTRGSASLPGESPSSATEGDTFICTNVVAKYSWKVKEKVKGKMKTVTKSVTRTFTLTVEPSEFGGVATLTETGGSQSSATEITAWQNLWGRADYKALGKKLFSTKSGKNTLAYKTFSVVVCTNETGRIYFKDSDGNVWADDGSRLGEAAELNHFAALSLKVTTSGAVTATLIYDTGKTAKMVPVYYKPTCATVVIPTSAADAETFTGYVPLFFAPSPSNGFGGFAGLMPL